MNIIINEKALSTLEKIGEFVENKNTLGSGNRYVTKFLNFIEETMLSFNNHQLCKSIQLYKMNYRCFFYNDWVVAYKKNENYIEVKIIIHGTHLNN